MAAISEEEFTRLQEQILDLRTKNYELGSKLHKAEAAVAELSDRCSNQEKEIQKQNKLMKFPGFQAITKSKSKKDLADLFEENERLTNQLQRQEEDFKLQNQTLVGEISHLSMENEKLKSTSSYDVMSTGFDIGKAEEVSKVASHSSQIYKNIMNLYERINVEHSDLFRSQHENTNNERLNEGRTIVDSDVCDTTDFSESITLEQRHILDFRDLFSYINEYHKFSGNAKTVDNPDNTSQSLHSFKEASRKEIAELREEVAKWTEKAKKKQESFLKLQVEKELLYEENKLARIKLEENHNEIIQDYKVRLIKAQDDLQKCQDSDDENELLSRIDILSNENQSMQAELISLREIHKDDLVSKSKYFEEQTTTLQATVEEAEMKLQSLLDEKTALVTKEQCLLENFQQLQFSLDQANELADKRKQLLDDSSKDLHKEIEYHQTKLEDIKTKHDDDVNTLTGNHSKEISDLKSQLVNQKKLKKDLDHAKEEKATLEKQIDALEQKCGWLQRTLEESQIEVKLAEETLVKQLREKELSFRDEKLSLMETHEMEIKHLQSAVKVAEVQCNDFGVLVEKLKQASKDREVEYRISSKKSDQLIKDLKRQLLSERKRADQSQSRLQDFIQDIKVKNTYEDIFNLSASHKRQDSGSHLSLASSVSGMENDEILSPKTSSPASSSTNIVNLSEETVDLISRVADLQQEKWVLEEKVRHLEENGAVMADDLVQKSLIIQTYVMENNGDVSPGHRRRSLTLKEKMMDRLKLTANDDLTKEKNLKMQRMLEETLARNVQLQKDVDYLSSRQQQLLKSKPDADSQDKS